jgi:periodic tryptophan protein 1
LVSRFTQVHGDDNSEDERAALEVLPTDSLILTAKTSDDLSLLELHVYDEREENLWVRNDLMVPSMPLCVEWLDFPPSQAAAQGGHEEQAAKKTHGNYVAVGTFDTAIEVWDLDVLDGLYPTAILGPPPGLIPDVPPPAPTGTGKKKKRAQPPPPPAANDKHHTQSVISLSWTSAHRNLLLSSSADGSIKLWDLSRPSPMEAIKSWTHHQGEKVLAVEWNRFGVQGCGGPVGAKAEFSTVVLSAGERSVMVWDSRAVGGVVSTGRLGADVECVKWDPWNAMDFFVSLALGAPVGLVNLPPERGTADAGPVCEGRETGIA